MASLTLEDGRSIVKLLECPVCLGTMRPPIFQCLNGHSVCSECKQKVEECPTCRGPFIRTRNRFTEDLANKVIYPCKNTVRGCNEKVPLEDLEKHESVCPHRMYHCLVGREDGCTWTGPRSDILPHTEDKHGKYVYTRDPCTMKHDNFNFFAKRKFSCIFSYFVEIFWFRSEHDPTKQRLYEMVQYIGPKDNASKYTYEHRLVSPSGDQKLTFVNVVRSETDELKDIHTLQKCFVMDYETLNIFKHNGAPFEYTVKMCRNN
jgi:E3 ubiquitin-protein ligase SIAH1